VNKTFEERFWEKVEKIENGCWLWTAATDQKGYGMIGIGATKTYRAHRISYEMVKGKIPDGLQMRHQCHTPACVNPDHLLVGTALQNTQDSIKAGRRWYCKGSAHGRSKLTEKDVKKIRILLHHNLQQVHIAKRFGVSQTAIWKIRTNSLWSHVK